MVPECAMQCERTPAIEDSANTTAIKEDGALASSEINDLQELLMGELVPPPQGSLSYPCELTKDGWVNAASGKPMMVRATYWSLQVERRLSSLATDLAIAICHGSAPHSRRDHGPKNRGAPPMERSSGRRLLDQRECARSVCSIVSLQTPEQKMRLDVGRKKFVFGRRSSSVQ